MMTTKRALVAAVALLAVTTIFTLNVRSQDPNGKSAGDQEMEAWMAYGEPGANHKALQPLVGTWSTDIKFWMAPGTPPEASQGTSKFKWVLGGRFLAEDFEGTAMDMPFTGMGFVGYDNFKKEYRSIWMDSFTTAIMVSSGTGSKDGKTITFEGKQDDPMTGEKNKPYRSVLHIGDGHHVFEMYTSGPDGKEFKNLEINYNRREQ